jgi:hypothetical protein
MMKVREGNKDEFCKRQHGVRACVRAPYTMQVCDQLQNGTNFLKEPLLDNTAPL